MARLGAIAALLGALTVATPATADTFGPYRYRIPGPEAVARWETRIAYDGTRLSVIDCQSAVIQGVAGAPICGAPWEPAAERDGDVLYWAGRALDLSTGVLRLPNGVEAAPGAIPWADAPLLD